MSKIKILDPTLIDQIAAGEVIENPASVLKELIENSIDAGSKNIIVQIVAGGKQLIRVSDDGDGMTLEDTLLSIQRHATSKIQNHDDLNQIMTMGFRGEALPSIASISKLTITSSVKKASGCLVSIEGGSLIKSCSAVRDKGTTIEVSDLFYNIPARRKFQKSVNQDISEILKTLNTLSLANPGIAIRCIAEQKKLIDVTSNEKDDCLKNYQERIAKVLGKDFAEGLISISEEHELVKIWGYIGKPHTHKPNRQGQFLFINNRPVVCPAIGQAIREAYGTLLPVKRFPAFVLHLKMSPNIIDPNVHPQKKEIRIYKERLIREIIEKLVEKQLGKKTFSSFQVEKPILRNQIQFENCNNWSLDTPSSLYALEKNNLSYEQKPLINHLELLGFTNKYLIIQGQEFQFYPTDGLIVIDYFAAKRAIIYHQLENKTLDSTWSSQNLLIPITFDVSLYESHTLQSHLNYLQECGFSLRSIGKGSFIIDAVPSRFSHQDIELFIRDLISNLSESNDCLKRDKNSLSKLLCKAAVHHEHVDRTKAQKVLEQFMNLPTNHEICPLGKKIWIELSKLELDKKFG